MKDKLKNLLIILIPLLVGGIASYLVDFKIYQEINLPKLAPPSILFPIVWTILYLMLGVCLLLLTKSNNSKENIIVFGIQLFLNFIWTLVFFGLKDFLLSFIIIVLLDAVVLYMIITYKDVNKYSSYLLIPYLLWIIFASYLNWMIFILN